ncbi:FAD-dependent oxidoreductase [Candidatus Parcubacteria bacterium]|nr:FAD-dependent oxidoreductase [Candidatus Parcubacteria bacterium]
MYDLIIIGGGPTGITAGIYAARQNLKTLLIAKSFGGQMTRKAVAIENYPGFEEISGMDLIQKFEEHLKKYEITIERDSVIELSKNQENFLVITKGKKQFQASAVIIASGADPRSLGVPGEKEFVGKGISFCVQCDGPLFFGKKVAIIGGGNAGFEAALSLSKIAEKIYILEYGAKAIADKTIQEKIKKKENTQVLTSAALKEIKGKEFVSSIVYQDRKTEKNIELVLDGVFIEIGSKPATNFIKDLVDFNERGEIKINLSNCQTKTEGLFAAGDVTEIKAKQIVIAAGEGAKAAISVNDYLQRKNED